MSDYTIKNLQEIDDAAPGFGLSPNLEARFGRSATGAERGGFSYQKLAPNFQQPFGHRHREQEEFYVVLSGGGRVTFGDGHAQELRQWDVVRVSAGTARGFGAGVDGLELLAFGAGAGGDAEVLESFWDELG